MSEPAYDENAKPEEFVNVVPEDSVDVTLAKDQTPVLDDDAVDDTPDDEEEPTGPPTEGA